MGMNTVQLAIALLLSLTERLGAVSQIIEAATSTGRTDLTEEELRTLLSADDTARDALVAALAGAKTP